MATFQSQINILAKAIVKTATEKVSEVTTVEKTATITYDKTNTFITDKNKVPILDVPLLGSNTYNNIIVSMTDGKTTYIDNDGVIHINSTENTPIEEESFNIPKCNYTSASSSKTISYIESIKANTGVPEPEA